MSAKNKKLLAVLGAAAVIVHSQFITPYLLYS